MRYLISSDCVRCGVCEFMCGPAAIVEAPNQFVVRRQLCNGCGQCVPYCPVHAIVPEDEFSARQRRTCRAQLRAIVA